ncbi:MAG: hypothetical protein V4598_01040 [Bdellovibrionota bacterium]
MKFLFLTLFISFSVKADFHRFYRGFTTLDSKNFLEVINRDFFPLFKEAHPQGLVNYRPLILNEPGLPNEIVILSFTNEEVYKAYTETEIGKKIRAAHGPVFDGQRSNSLVPTVLNKEVKAESAYLLNEGELPQGATGVLILSEPYGTPEGTLKEVESMMKLSGKKDAIILVAKDYVIEYLFAADEKALDKLRSERCSGHKRIFKTNKFITLKKQKIGAKNLTYGEGMDTQW